MNPLEVSIIRVARTLKSLGDFTAVILAWVFDISFLSYRMEIRFLARPLGVHLWVDLILGCPVESQLAL